MSELANLQAEAWNIRSLLTRFTQDTRLIKLTTPLGVDLLAECVRGEEGVSQGYVFQIDALERSGDAASTLWQIRLARLNLIGLILTAVEIGYQCFIKDDELEN